ncbi:MAG TPA: malto-oligosyltrehalose synthase, partial [Gemmatimonadaceae bacterium]|nr:malto-oligosyltrehalose synthase [Gemmatimonadaceae bacterium]
MSDTALTATYRVQLNKEFRLADARAIVPYLDRLGVSHLYCSPILAARPGSTHGYDVIDPKRVNPEIGTLEELRALSQALHERKMGILLDIVPNHMGVGESNSYWEDVLTHGLRSRYARWFDVDWEGADNKIVLPVLGDELDKVIDRDEITLDVKEKTPRLRYFDNSWPVDPATLPEELQLAKLDPTAVSDPAVFIRGEDGHQRLRALLDAQHYRLAFWRRGPTEINYRRFFDVNELAALRQEDPEVFAETHELILSLVEEGVIDGLRVDHVDGLLDPLGYLERLREEVERRAPPSDGAVFPIVVEKILSPGEKLRRSWPVQGTTGYEFLNDLEDIFLDRDGYAAIERRYRSLRRLTSGDFADVAHAGKVKILEGALQADVDRLVRRLQPLANDRSPEPKALAKGIVQFIAALPVYRTYVDGRSATPDPDDVAVLDRAVEVAQKRSNGKAPVVDLIRSTVLDASSDARLGFVQRLQQTSGPATAKGV